VVLAVHEARVLERESSLLPLAAAAARHSSGRLVGPGEGGGGVGRIVFQPEGALAPDGLYLLDSPQRGSAAASSPSRVVNSCLPVIYTLEQEAMQEIPAWPRYTGVLFFGARPRGRRLHGHHPPPVQMPGLRPSADWKGLLRPPTHKAFASPRFVMYSYPCGRPRG
jgi:hypothetical protein